MSTLDHNGAPLINLQMLLDGVFTKVESKQEIRQQMEKFSRILAHTAQQVGGSVSISIPTMTDLSDRDPSKGNILHETLKGWTAKIAQLLESSKKKSDNETTAMGEIEFWRTKSASLSALHQQFQLQQVKDIIKMAEDEKESSENGVLEAFQRQLAQLTKDYAVAKDNVKFLNTLERQFKTIEKGSLLQIEETLASLMNGLRLVWTISRHYKNEEMIALELCIANEIADRVESEIKVSEIFRNEEQEKSLELIDRGIRVLDKWYETVTQTKKEVDTGDNNHWPSDKKLFDRTKHIKSILQEMKEAVVCLKEFFSFLNKDLKKVTGDTQGIEDVIEQVKSVSKPLEAIGKVFLMDANNKPWNAPYAKFKEEVKIIENKTINMIVLQL